MNVCFYTLGCKLNQAETQILKESLSKRGGSVVLKDNKKFDYCLINSCSVTNKAEKETRQLIRRIKKDYPQAKIIVTGCWTNQTFKNKNINNQVDFWFKNKDKEKIFDLFALQKKIKKNDKPEKTRVFIKIQHGCKNYCSYCIVPYLRSDIYSRSIKEVIEEIKSKNKRGIKEVVLVGTNIGMYKYGLVNLLKQILKLTKIQRIRISSLWPTLLTNDLLDLIKQNKRICPHIHLSIQSGSNKILSLMKRNYNQTDLTKVINKIKENPEITVSADIIVGFPKETDKDFLQTYNFVKLTEFLKIHVFRYSPKKGTSSYDFDGKVNPSIKKTRAQKIRIIGEKTSKNVRKKYIGKKALVLFEEKKDNFWQGWTTNYIKVYLKTSKNIENKILKVELIKLYKNGLMGKI